MIYIALSLLVILAYIFIYFYGRGIWHPVYTKLLGSKTTEQVIKRYGQSAEYRLIPYFKKAGVRYPPNKLALIALKNEKQLELWASNNDEWNYINTYPIKAASGTLGPKLKEGDRQVPEGIYKIIGLNPNSSYHLSMKLNYPNKFDLYHAEMEGRSEPGSNIFIHGKKFSIGCLAMGDDAIEELFVLIYKTGKENVKVIISPYDFRKVSLFHVPANSPEWTNILYLKIKKELIKFKKQT